jgi:iron complex outermembrane recepter protein
MTMSHPRKTKVFARLLAAALFLPTLAVLQAQPSSVGDDEPLTLSPFDVVAHDDGSYVVERTTTGTRVAADLMELPFNLHVVTEAFLQDFLADTLEEQFAYVSSFAYEEESTNAYSLRGFRTNFQLRDGFARSGLFNRATISRAEVIKGPAAAIYGRTQPGGVINYLTKKPQDRTRTQFTVAGGTDDYRRVGLNTTGTVFKNEKFKLRYRVDLDHRYEEYDQGGQVRPFTEEYIVSTVWDLTFNDNRSKIQISADRTVNNRLPLSRAPIIYVPNANSAAGEKTHRGLAEGLDKLGYNNIRGTGQKRELRAVNLLFEQKLSQHLDFRAGADYADRDFFSREMDQFVRRYDITTRGLTGRQPQFEFSEEQFFAVQADLLATFHVKKTEHKLLLTTDYFQQRTFDQNWRLNQVRPARVAPALRPLAAVNDPAANETWMPAPPSGTNEVSVLRPIEQLGTYYPDIVPFGSDLKGRPYQRTTYNNRQLTTRGVFSSWRMAALGGKVISLLGGRYEESSFIRNNIGQGTYETFTNEGFTPSYGLNVYVHPQVTLFSNYSRSYFPSQRTGFDSDGDPVEGGLPNEEGTGTDIGLKMRLWDNKLVLTTTYFTIERRNVAYLVDFPSGTPGATEAFDRRYASAGLIEGDGFEVDFSFRVVDGFNFFGSYSYNDTVVKEAGYDVDLVGKRWQRAPSLRWATGFTYRVPGVKALTLNGGVRYEGDNVFDNGSPVRLATDPLNGNQRTGNDGRREMLNPDYTNVDLGATYEFRSKNRWRHRLQFNVKNVTGDDTYRQGGLPAPPRRFILTYRIEV